MLTAVLEWVVQNVPGVHQQHLACVVQGKYSTLTLGQLCNVVYCGMFLSQMSCSVVHSNCQELCKIKMKRY